MKASQGRFHSSKQNYKSGRQPVLLNGIKYWIYRRYGTGHYMLSDYTRMTIKILKNAGWVGEIPMTRTGEVTDILPEMKIDKALCQMTLPENERLLHLI